MRVRARLLSLLVCPLACVLADPAARADGTIVDRRAVEARGRSHGEVRLLRRDGAAVVQTLLVTRNLRRVAARIRDKEEEAWGADSPDYGTARLYVEALEDAVDRVLSAEQAGRVRRLLIEVELVRDGGRVLFAAPVTADGEAGPTVVEARPLSHFEVPCAWARRELELVAGDRGLDLEALRPLPSCAR